MRRRSGRSHTKERIEDAGYHSPRLRNVQTKELYDDEEQTQNARQAHLEEVLQVLPDAYDAQGIEVAQRPKGRPPSSWYDGTARMKASGSIGRASDSKSEGWGFESLLACSDTQRSANPRRGGGKGQGSQGNRQSLDSKGAKSRKGAAAKPRGPEKGPGAGKGTWERHRRPFADAPSDAHSPMPRRAENDRQFPTILPKIHSKV